MATMSKLQVASGRPGWADLPHDLLESVLARLPVPDTLRFPAVCTAWRWAAATARLHDQTMPSSPWLMLPFNPTANRRTRRSSEGDARLLSEARFLSLTEGRTYAIRQPAPAVSDRFCVGSSDGWLITADDASELHLLNPVTGAQVKMPSITTLPHVSSASRDADGRVVSYTLRCCFSDDDNGDDDIPPETFAADRLRYELYEKAILVSAPRRLTPSSSSSGTSCCWGGYAVLLICQPLFRLAIARAGDTGWTLLDTPGRCWVDAVRASVVTHGTPQRSRVLYTMDTAGRVDAWDWDMDASAATPTPSTRVTIAPPCSCSGRSSCSMSAAAACHKYLVELSPGRLLQVHRLREAAHARYSWEPRPEHVEYTTAKVELFEFDWAAAREGGSQQWVRVDSDKRDGVLLAGRALFLGKSASLCVPAVDGALTLKGNCVYFTDDGQWSYERCHEVVPDVGVFDLADGSYRPPRGTVPDLLWKWPPPVWVFPSLAN